MKTKHTPGEWKLIETFNHFCISDRDDFMSTNNEFGNIATVDQNAINYCGKKEANANAKLIAAAPDMLDALMVAKAHLEYAIEFGAGAGGETKAIMIIDRAINKATL